MIVEIWKHVNDNIKQLYKKKHLAHTRKYEKAMKDYKTKYKTEWAHYLWKLEQYHKVSGTMIRDKAAGAASSLSSSQPETPKEVMKKALKDFYQKGSVFSFSLFGRVMQGRVHFFNEDEVLWFRTTDDTGKLLLLAMQWQDYKDLKKLPK